MHAIILVGNFMSTSFQHNNMKATLSMSVQCPNVQPNIWYPGGRTILCSSKGAGIAIPTRHLFIFIALPPHEKWHMKKSAFRAGVTKNPYYVLRTITSILKLFRTESGHRNTATGYRSCERAFFSTTIKSATDSTVPGVKFTSPQPCVEWSSIHSSKQNSAFALGKNCIKILPQKYLHHLH